MPEEKGQLGLAGVTLMEQVRFEQTFGGSEEVSQENVYRKRVPA